jgi:Mor family transcriptional regulator
LQRRPRDAELLAMHRDGAGIERLCQRFRLSRRSVFRIIAAARSAVAVKLGQK